MTKLRTVFDGHECLNTAVCEANAGKARISKTGEVFHTQYEKNDHNKKSAENKKAVDWERCSFGREEAEKAGIIIGKKITYQRIIKTEYLGKYQKIKKEGQIVELWEHFFVVKWKNGWKECFVYQSLLSDEIVVKGEKA